MPQLDFYGSEHNRLLPPSELRKVLLRRLRKLNPVHHRPDFNISKLFTNADPQFQRLNAPGEPRDFCERRSQIGWLGNRVS